MMVTNLKGKDCRQRLEELGITTLEERKVKGEPTDLVPDICSTGWDDRD